MSLSQWGPCNCRSSDCYNCHDINTWNGNLEWRKWLQSTYEIVVCKITSHLPLDELMKLDKLWDQSINADADADAEDDADNEDNDDEEDEGEIWLKKINLEQTWLLQFWDKLSDDQKSELSKYFDQLPKWRNGFGKFGPQTREQYFGKDLTE